MMIYLLAAMTGAGGCQICGDGAGTGFIFAGTGGDGCDGLHPCSSLLSSNKFPVYDNANRVILFNTCIIVW